MNRSVLTMLKYRLARNEQTILKGHGQTSAIAFSRFMYEHVDSMAHGDMHLEATGYVRL